MNELNHVGVIMDGNRRWANRNRLETVLGGHEKGVRKLMELCTWCLARNIRYLTVYAFSTENWQRSEFEINGLFALMDKFFTEQLQSCLDKGIRIFVSGDRERLPEKQIHVIEDAERGTASCDKLLVQVAISYGGRDEVVRAARAAAERVRDGLMRVEDITESTLQSFFDRPDFPMIDMVIRTGGYPRLSNFFIWQTAYSELYFTDTLWPDLTEDEFEGFYQRYNDIKINNGK